MMEILLRESNVQKIQPGYISEGDAEEIIREYVKKEDPDIYNHIVQIEIRDITYRHQVSYNSYGHLAVRIWPYIYAAVMYSKEGYTDHKYYYIDLQNNDALVVFDAATSQEIIRFAKKWAV